MPQVMQSTPTRRRQSGPAFNLHTIADAYRHCREIAQEHGIRRFACLSMFASNGKEAADQLFDTDGWEKKAPQNLGTHGLERMIQHSLESVLPLCWGDGLPCADVCIHAASLVESRAGFAFPVQAERGRTGYFLFLDPQWQLSREAICDLHMQCFALFRVIASLPVQDLVEHPGLSKRELECLKLTANGQTSEDIAKKLGLSVHTANQYLVNSTVKLNAVSRVHAVAKALRLGLID
ncbi:helix-turn-helix transcriptional regulator [Limoniibacter endophyticus]|uniref:Helix-turn-helix transcriptional regulator n=1 Tax=Limoniibacter endophyticus TaxID=1565040 RepID=A0A8J3GGC1_9HYPH|nr:helix-turn-helix transcriptional regulator [Limoniibacter endophyticus]GHC64664.1 helix-turn-helix transcriptional regulator [Limoniibacter endophyticus]